MNNKKLMVAIFAVSTMILSTITTAFADNGQSNVNITFIVLTCILAPSLVGIIVYYALKAKKANKSNTPKANKKIIRDYDDK